MAPASNAVTFKNLIVVLAWMPLILIIAAIVWWNTDVTINNERLRQKSEAVAQSLRVPAQLKLQGKEWFGTPAWTTNAPQPRLTYTYKLIGSKKDVYVELKQTLIEICGPNTPEVPFRVSGDDEKFMYLGAVSCKDKVGIDYGVEENSTARIVFTPYVEPQ